MVGVSDELAPGNPTPLPRNMPATRCAKRGTPGCVRPAEVARNSPSGTRRFVILALPTRCESRGPVQTLSEPGLLPYLGEGTNRLSRQEVLGRPVFLAFPMLVNDKSTIYNV